MNDAGDATTSSSGCSERGLTAALEPTDVVIGGGNARKLDALPPGCRMGDNANAFLGGFRLWEPASGQNKAAVPATRRRSNAGKGSKP
jgi:hypothetical protein